MEVANGSAKRPANKMSAGEHIEVADGSAKRLANEMSVGEHIEVVGASADGQTVSRKHVWK